MSSVFVHTRFVSDETTVSSLPTRALTKSTSWIMRSRTTSVANAGCEGTNSSDVNVYQAVHMPTKLYDGRIESFHMAYHEDPVVPLRDHHEFLCFLNGKGDRLFDEDIEPSLDQGMAMSA